MKKKAKRDADPTRQDYARILKDSGIEVHEIAGGAKSSNFEVSNDLVTEAHAVADAMGLPIRFEPALRSFQSASDRALQYVDSAKRDDTTITNRLSPSPRPISPAEVLKSPTSIQLESPAMSGDEESEEEDEEEGDFEAVPGHTLLDNQPEYERKEKLHEMEQGEASALLLGRKGSMSSAGSSGSGGGEVPIDEDDDEEEDESEIVMPTAPLPS